tara:strand:- start:580 stop:897 length:318 start_codon:yes stop_codon:yes gene_type:complete
MFNPDEIKKVLGNNPESQQKLQELLSLLEKNKQDKKSNGSGSDKQEDLEEAPSRLQQDPDLRYKIAQEEKRKMLKQRLYAMKAKRMTNSGKSHMQDKLKKKFLDK